MSQNYKFNKFDISWIVVNIGMAVGAGIVLVPVSVGVVGFAVFMISILIAYPGIYLFQKLYIQTLFESKQPKDYKQVVSDLLGNKWSAFLGTLYLLMMIIWTVIYAEVVAKSLASYLYMFNLTTDSHLEESSLYCAILMITLIFFGIKNHKIFVRISTFLVAVLVVAIIIVSISLIPLWSTNNLLEVPHINSEFIAKSIIMLPFSLTSILFIQSLSPMVISYRSHYRHSPKSFILNKTLRTMSIAFIILVTIIGFYVLSFSLVIKKSQALAATISNQSAFILLENQGQSNNILYVCGIIISLSAILTSFLSILAGLEESLRGILKEIFRKNNLNNEKKGLFNINNIVILIIFLLTWLSIVFNLPVYKLVPLSGPIFGILGCLVPTYIVFKTPNLKKYRSNSIYFIIFIGIILIISPFLTSSLS